MAKNEDYSNLQAYLKDNVGKIEQKLNSFFKVLGSKELLDIIKTRGTHDLQTFQDSICTPSYEAVVESGGKRVRPILTVLVHDIIRSKSQQYKHIYDISVIPELIHKGTIVIDDIQDNTLERNGRQALHAKYGEDIAINVGNFLYFAYNYLLDHPDLFLEGNGDRKIGEQKQDMIRKAVSQELQVAHVGQGADLAWGKGKALIRQLPTEKEYNQMAVGKSTFPLATRIGAISGGATEEDQSLCREIGEYAGLAFQIWDDLLDLNPNATDFGGDIREKKPTLPVIYTLKKEDKLAGELRKILESKELSQSDAIKRAIEIMNESGAVEYTKEQAHKHANKAISIVRERFSSNETNQPTIVLEELVRYGVEREN